MKREHRIIETLIHIIIWLAFYMIFIFLVKTIGPFKKADGTLLMPATIGTLINAILFYTTSLYLIPRLSERKKVMEFVGLLTVVFGCLTMAETMIDTAFFRPIYSSNKESVLAQFILNMALNLVILSLALGYGFAKNWIRNERAKQKLQEAKLSAELNFMRSQLNPHFLFNVLNMAYSSASRSGDEKTADIVEKLSGLLRYMLYECNVERIELEKEAEYIRNYINLQKMRFSEDMKVKVNFLVEGDFKGLRIAPMILIQFIENAFKFGVKLEKESEILISIRIENHNLEFAVKNHIFINESNKNSLASGIGIENVKRRLEILYSGKHDLKIENNEEFFTVILSMNLN